MPDVFKVPKEVRFWFPGPWRPVPVEIPNSRFGRAWGGFLERQALALKQALDMKVGFYGDLPVHIRVMIVRMDNDKKPIPWHRIPEWVATLWRGRLWVKDPVVAGLTLLRARAGWRGMVGTEVVLTRKDL